MFIESDNGILDIDNMESFPFIRLTDQTGLIYIDHNGEFESNNFICKNDILELYTSGNNILQICEAGVYINNTKLWGIPSNWIVNVIDEVIVVAGRFDKKTNYAIIYDDGTIDKYEVLYTKTLLPYLLMCNDDFTKFAVRSIEGVIQPTCNIIDKYQVNHYTIIIGEDNGIYGLLIARDMCVGSVLQQTPIDIGRIVQIVELRSYKTLIRTVDNQYYLITGELLYPIPEQSFDLLYTA